MLNKSFLLAFLLFNLVLTGYGQHDLVRKLNSLKLGRSDMNDVKRIFGEPDHMEKRFSFVKGDSTSRRVDYYVSDSTAAQNFATGTHRTMYTLTYARAGLVFWFFDDPWELHSFEVSTRNFWSNGIRVGDSLSTVLRIHGKGDWSTSSGREDWDLEYERLGVRYTFLRAPAVPQFPLALERKQRVKSIEVYDKRVHFLG